ncbi:MAG: cytochrome P450 [Herpetosiphonaceae bacterium]|nr:cytochrome P450 [Herpetosiphonaceae bacterium]
MPKTVEQLPVLELPWDNVMAGELPTMLAQMATEQGPIFQVPVDDADEANIFMVGPEANRFVLHTHREHFSHDKGWTPIIGDDFGHGLLNMDDPEHARHRKMWNPAFTSACMEAYVPLMQAVIADRARRWPERGVVDMQDESRQITFGVAATVLAGFHSGVEVDRLRELFYTMLHGFDEARDNWDSYAARAAAARGELVRTLLQLIARRRAMPLADSPRDVLSVIVHARDEDGEPLTDVQVLAHLNILLVAGHETTTTLGGWVLYRLATQPKLWQRVQAEVARGTQEDGTITAETLRGLRLLDMVIRETGRLNSPVINVPRGVVSPFEFGGYQIPAGRQVRLGLAASHRLPSVWREPERFDPERFAPPREEDKRQPYALVTFGGGPRVCIGINFAQIEVKALVAHVIQHYDLATASDQMPIHTGWWTAEVPGGIPMRVTGRTTVGDEREVARP